MSSEKSLPWREAQQFVADFLSEYGFSIQQEVTLKGGGRVDIIALKKTQADFLNIVIEVKDWEKVSRKKESEFCKQIIAYIVNYAYEKMRKSPTKGLWERKELESKDKFIGILCLTKDAHFSFRQVSHHFIEKHPQIQGIPFREQIAERLEIFVTRFDFLPKVFEKIGYPLYKDSKINEWFPKK